VTGVTWEWH